MHIFYEYILKMVYWMRTARNKNNK